MTNIAVFHASAIERNYLQEKLQKNSSDHELAFFEQVLSEDSIPDAAKDATIISVFVDSAITAKVLEAFPNLKLIATRSTGYDHIDMNAAKEKNILVATVPTYGENTVAEHAFGLLLALSKRIVDGTEQVKGHGDFDPSNLIGFDLKGKTLGVIGTGRIGQYAIKIGNGFSMNVIGFDAFPKKELEQELHFSYAASLEELLAQSDVITIHVPYMPQTHHLINKTNIGKVKQGAVIINTSRGQIVETEALFDALVSKQVAGAGLDVVEEESAVKDEIRLLATDRESGHDLKVMLMNHKLIDMPNVIITPHSAFNTKEALERILATTVDNITSFEAGTPKNTVTIK